MAVTPQNFPLWLTVWGEGTPTSTYLVVGWVERFGSFYPLGIETDKDIDSSSAKEIANLGAAEYRYEQP